MTTPDYPDWASPTFGVDQASGIPAASGNYTNNNPLDLGDLTRYASLNLSITLGSNGGGTRYLVRVRWLEGATVVGEDTLTFHDSPSYGGMWSRLLWRLPVKGTNGTVTVFTADPAGLTLVAVASTRELREPVVRMVPNNTGAIGAETGRLILHSGNMALAAGAASAVLYVPPVARALTFTVNTVLGKTLVDISGVHYQAGGFALDLVRRTYDQWLGQSLNEIPLVGVGLELVLTNQDTASHTVAIFGWDVS